MSRGTDRRTVRVAPELWERAGRVAVSNDETISDAIRRYLTWYVQDAPVFDDLCSCASGAQPVHGSHAK